MEMLPAKERNSIFLDVCDIICPEYAERRGKLKIGDIARTFIDFLVDFNKRNEGLNLKEKPVNMKELYLQADRFKMLYPDGKFVEEEILKRPIRGSSEARTNYVGWASEFIKKQTGMYLPTVFGESSFYEAVIDHCLIDVNKNPLFGFLDKRNPWIGDGKRI